MLFLPLNSNMGNVLARTGADAATKASSAIKSASFQTTESAKLLALSTTQASENALSGLSTASRNLQDGASELGQHIESSAAWLRLGLKETAQASVKAADTLNTGMKDVGNGLSGLADAHGLFATEVARATHLGSHAVLLLAHESRAWRRTLTMLIPALGVSYYVLPVLLAHPVGLAMSLHPVLSGLLLANDPLNLVWRPQAVLALNAAGRFLLTRSSNGDERNEESSRTMGTDEDNRPRQTPSDQRTYLLLASLLLSLLPLPLFRSFILFIDLAVLFLLASAFLLDKTLVAFGGDLELELERRVSEQLGRAVEGLVGMCGEGVVEISERFQVGWRGGLLVEGGRERERLHAREQDED